MSRMRSVSAPFSISSIRAILSSVIVVYGVRVRCRYPHSNRRLAMTTSSVACSYTTPWGTTRTPPSPFRTGDGLLDTWIMLAVYRNAHQRGSSRSRHPARCAIGIYTKIGLNYLDYETNGGGPAVPVVRLSFSSLN